MLLKMYENKSFPVLTEMQSNLQSDIDNLALQIADMDERVESAANNLRGAENRLTNVPEGVSITPYQNADQSGS